MSKSIENILEAVLFANGEPVEIKKIAQALEATEQEIKTAAAALCERYNSQGSGLEILFLGDSLQMSTGKEYEQPIKAVMQVKRSTQLSAAAFEVLAVIAYNQPVTRGFIEQVRGVDSSHMVASLVEKGLIEEVGRMDLPGRPIGYRTTENFLRCFCLDSIKSLPALPKERPVQNEKEPEEPFLQMRL